MIRLDQVVTSSFHEAFRNRETATGSITLSGTIPNGGATFTLDVTTARDDAVIEGYYRKSGLTYSRRVDAGVNMLDVTWGHPVRMYISNPTSSTTRVTIEVTNPGAGAAISSQTYNFKFYIFDTPFS